MRSRAQRTVWMIVAALLLAAAGAVGAATQEAEEVPAQEEAVEPTAVPEEAGAELATCTEDVVEPEILEPGVDVAPAAICRLIPECDSNDDCDAVCGVGEGRCGHSRCPVRLCKC